MSKDPAELYERVNAAAIELLDADSAPFLVVLTKEELGEYLKHQDSSRWFKYGGAGLLEICGLPIRPVWTRDHIPEGLVFSKIMAQVAFPGEYQ